MQNRKPYHVAPRSTVMFVMDEGGGGGNTPPQITPEVQALIDAAVAQQVQGLKNKNSELIEAEKKLKERLKGFEGVDLEKWKQLQERLDADEDAKLLAEGKKELVIEKYTTRMREAHQGELAKMQGEIEAERKRTENYRGAVLDNTIRQVCSGLHKGAVEDALLHARQIFTLDDKGNAVKLGADGSPELGKDGKTPFSPAEWIEHQKELKPHWFPSATSGSGSGEAAPGKGGTGKQMSRSEFDKLPVHRQGEVVRAGTKITD